MNPTPALSPAAMPSRPESPVTRAEALPHPGAPDAATARPHARLLGALLVGQGLLSLAPMAVLGPAIGWPASLDLPAAQQLAAIHAQPQAVAAGYGIYLLYSVAIAPLMAVLAWRLLGGLRMVQALPWVIAIAVLAGLSTLARSVGILRWLTVMPELAVAHAQGDPAARLQVERLFSAVHSYGGGIGELLGVGLFMALALGALAWAAGRARTLPWPLAVLGGLSALLLAGLVLPSVGVPLEVPMVAAVSTLSVWMMATGLWLARPAGWR